MKAAVCYEFGKPLVVDDLDIEPPRAGEVSVKIAACAVCHSDITYIDGGWGGRLPKVFGHEAAGVVEEVGAGVQSVARGDRVLVTLLRSCGRCGVCQSGRPNICGAKFPLDREARMKNAAGVTVKQGLRTGAFAEYALVDPSQLAPIPDDMPFDSASLLSCGVITGFGAVVNTAALPAGASAAVIGCGGVGLNAVQGAAFAGAHPLVAVDVVARKLQTAQEFGATHTIDALETGAANLRAAIDANYRWALGVDYTATQHCARFWYVSEEKLEPRLGERFEEDGAVRELPLAFARDIAALRADLAAADAAQPLADFLLARPQHRHAARRAQLTARFPYAEIRDNLISARLRPIDLLRCKLSFFGANRFDPKSDRWVRITMYQHAPLPDELARMDADDWAFPPPPPPS